MARTATAAAAAASPSTTDEEIDNAAAATCTKIQAEARKITIRLHDVNANLICALCRGYFLDAHKIKECADTFCGSCIRKYFSYKANRFCPTCRADLGPDPLKYLVADPAYQGIVDKLLPEFAAREEAMRRVFYERLDLPLKAVTASAPHTTKQGNGGPAKTATAPTTTSTEIQGKPVEKIEFELHPQNGPGIPLFLHLERLKQPRMATDASFRIQFLRKYLALKLKLSSPSRVEILCRGVPVGGEYSLAFVHRTIWLDPKNKTANKMILEYRGTVV